MGSFSIWHWLIVLLIVVLVFGTKKLKNIGSDLGGAVKGFKDGVKDGGRVERNAGRAAAAGHDQQGEPTPTRSTSRRRPSPEVAGSVLPGMIDFGFDKIALIGAVALIVIGPEKLPRVARTVGHLLGKAQRYVADVKAEVNRSIELEELKKMKTQFEDAARNVEQSVGSEISEDHERARAQLERCDGSAARRQRPARGRCSRRRPSTATRRRTGASSAAPRRSGTSSATACARRRQSGAARVARFRPPRDAGPP